MQKSLHFRRRWLRTVFFILPLSVVLISAFGQSSEVPTSLSPGKSEAAIKANQHYQITKKQKPIKQKRARVQHTKEYEFYARVEQAAKEKQKILKELYKPQYSNFKNFGHKKIPRKRPPHKMRYCDECGIRH
ncbi:MAG: hypothetical protein HC811_03525 [Flammeovirgaceae bacterium]|nr:hypothetical protein [Flammeovirgaceae bacterium]